MGFDAEALIGSVLKGALSGRRKRTRRVQRMLTRRDGLLNSRTLLALAGVAWGLYETATQRGEARPSAPPATWPVAGPGAPPPTGAPADLPASTAAPAPASVTPAVPEGVLRVIRLTVSAARADGTLSDVERESILTHARAAGAEAIVAHEIDAPVPLAQIVGGVTDAALREDLYTLAFAIVRADESVSGGERVYLAQLAHALGLGPDVTARLERTTAARIDNEEPGDGPADRFRQGDGGPHDEPEDPSRTPER